MSKIIKTQVTGMLCNMKWFLLSTQSFSIFLMIEHKNCMSNCPFMKANHTSSSQLPNKHNMLSELPIVLSRAQKKRFNDIKKL